MLHLSIDNTTTVMSFYEEEGWALLFMLWLSH